MSEYNLTDMTLFKVLNEDGSCHHSGRGGWHLPGSGAGKSKVVYPGLPKGDKPGKWMTPIQGTLIPCENGYHLLRPQDVVQWLGPALFVAECKGEIVEAEDKVVVRKARLLYRLNTWNDKTARLFACDCAERALALIEKPDERSVNAVVVARKFASGEATSEELAAARAAARAAAWDAARAAAWAAAGDAAWDAAWAAAWDAARAAEQKWQTDRLMQYLRGEVK